MKIRSKILVFVLSTTLTILIISLGFYNNYIRQKELADAYRITDIQAKEYSNLINSDINFNIGISKSISQILASYSENKEFRIDLYDEFLKNIFTEIQNYTSIWVIWEAAYSDQDSLLTNNKIRSIIHEYGGQVIVIHDTIILENENLDEIYNQAKINLDDIISNPYIENKEDEILITSICSPIIKDGNFIGLVGLNLPLKKYQDLLNNIKSFEDGFVYLFSNDCKFISHPNKAFINQKYDENFPYYDEKYEVSQKIKMGESLTFSDKIRSDKYLTYNTFMPVNFIKTKTPWSLGITIPLNKIYKGSNNALLIILVICTLGIILLVFIILYLVNDISSALIITIRTLENLAKGDISKTNKLRVKSTEDEIGLIKRSVNSLIDGLNNALEFAKKIGEGNLNANYQPLSDQDVLGSSLIEMQRNLQKAKDEEVDRKIEDSKRNWVTQGLTQLSEILRQNRRNIEDFSNNIISNLTKYVEANQGGLFVLNDDDRSNLFVELVASYAFNRTRMLQKKINFGVGLIGQCILEKATINLTEIPKNYITLTSGLGESNPRNILLVPLIFDDIVYGVIELASFKKFEKYQIVFIEKFGENVAAAISNIKINLRTEDLLEESRRKTNELAYHDQEMHLAIQELQVSYEEAIKREFDLKSVINSISTNFPIIHFDLSGTILKVERDISSHIQFYTEDLIGRNHKEFAIEYVENPEWYESFWNRLRSGRMQKRLLEINKDEIFVEEYYLPLFSKEGKITQIICLQNDITVERNKKIKYKTEISELQLELKNKRSNSGL